MFQGCLPSLGTSTMNESTHLCSAKTAKLDCGAELEIVLDEPIASSKKYLFLNLLVNYKQAPEFNLECWELQRDG